MIRRRHKTTLRSQRTRGFSIPKRLSVLILTILLLAIPVVIYFTRYISSQTTYFTSQNFRELAGISEQLEQRITQSAEIYERAVEETLIDPESSLPGQSATIFERNLQGTGLRRAATDEKDLKPGAKGPQKARMEIVTGGEDSRIRFVSDVKALPAEKPLSEIIGPLMEKRSPESVRGSDHEQGFDAILIATLDEVASKNSTDGRAPRSKVIFQSHSPELDIDSLDNLVLANAPDKIIDLRTVIDNTGAAEVKIADQDYKLYVQPIQLPIATFDEKTQTATDAAQKTGSRWIVCGLVQTAHFRRQTWAFPYTALIIVGFLTVLVALSWPFLKLIFIGPKDRFRLADIYFIAFAFLIGSALLTFLTLYGLTYPKSESELDGQLKELAETIVGHPDSKCPDAFCPGTFHNEIRRINKEVELIQDRFNKRPYDRTYILDDDNQIAMGQKSKDKQKAVVTKKDSSVDGPNRKSDIGPAKPVSLAQDSDTTPLRDSDYPYFQRAAWTDNKGTMLALWSTTNDTSRVSVGTRDWFRRIMEGKSRDLGGDPLWLEVVTSKYTGNKTAVVSKPIYDANDGKTIVGFWAWIRA